jgi:DNA-binding NtrC family response regulator
MPQFGEEANQECRVLLVEDEQRLRDLLLRAIPDMGFAARGCGSAEEALRQMEADPAQIIVLDLNLPGMSGLEFLEALRKRKVSSAVIILTGFGDLDTARKAIHLDIVDFLTKPCPLGELEVALDRARRRVQPHVASLTSPLVLKARMLGATPGSAGEGAAGGKSAKEQAAEMAKDAELRSQRLDDLERVHILAALKRHSGNRTATAHELGISLRTLYYRLSEYQKAGMMEGE